MYSRLIHTVDHVEGFLRPEFDSLDAFLCHTWAVTVTGAPKTWAIQFVEDSERSPRHWYGGAVGMIGFDGGLNTGLTLRTVRVKKGVAEVCFSTVWLRGICCIGTWPSICDGSSIVFLFPLTRCELVPRSCMIQTRQQKN